LFSVTETWRNHSEPCGSAGLFLVCLASAPHSQALLFTPGTMVVIL